MSATVPHETAQASIYPDSDGKPMADNTLQFRWIVTIQGGFDALYRTNQNVFVAGDLLWYPVEGEPKIRMAPDILIAFGRPKGYRGSYIQHREGGIAPQVVFEVLSPGNTATEMSRKLGFYQRYGVEEYYLYDPDNGRFDGWLRAGSWLEPIDDMEAWISPRTGVTFLLKGLDLLLLGPDGKQFRSYIELEQEREAAEQRVAQERQGREAAEQRVAQERQGREAAEQRAAQERQGREAAEQRAARLAERLRALGMDPDA